MLDHIQVDHLKSLGSDKGKLLPGPHPGRPSKSHDGLHATLTIVFHKFPIARYLPCTCSEMRAGLPRRGPGNKFFRTRGFRAYAFSCSFFKV